MLGLVYFIWFNVTFQKLRRFDKKDKIDAFKRKVWNKVQRDGRNDRTWMLYDIKHGKLSIRIFWVFLNGSFHGMKLRDIHTMMVPEDNKQN